MICRLHPAKCHYHNVRSERPATVAVSISAEEAAAELRCG